MSTLEALKRVGKTVVKTFSCTREEEARLEYAYERVKALRESPGTKKYSFSRFILDMVLSNPELTAKILQNGSHINQEASAS